MWKLTDIDVDVSSLCLSECRTHRHSSANVSAGDGGRGGTKQRENITFLTHFCLLQSEGILRVIDERC